MEQPVASSASAAEVEATLDDLLARLSLEQQVALMAGSAAFTVPGVERLGIAPLRLTDGPDRGPLARGRVGHRLSRRRRARRQLDPDLVREVGRRHRPRGPGAG